MCGRGGSVCGGGEVVCVCGGRGGRGVCGRRLNKA